MSGESNVEWPTQRHLVVVSVDYFLVRSDGPNAEVWIRATASRTSLKRKRSDFRMTNCTWVMFFSSSVTFSAYAPIDDSADRINPFADVLVREPAFSLRRYIDEELRYLDIHELSCSSGAALYCPRSPLRGEDIPVGVPPRVFDSGLEQARLPGRGDLHAAAEFI